MTGQKYIKAAASPVASKYSHAESTKSRQYEAMPWQQSAHEVTLRFCSAML